MRTSLICMSPGAFNPVSVDVVHHRVTEEPAPFRVRFFVFAAYRDAVPSR
jgi:hypothetical protein